MYVILYRFRQAPIATQYIDVLLVLACPPFRTPFIECIHISVPATVRLLTAAAFQWSVSPLMFVIAVATECRIGRTVAKVPLDDGKP